MHLRTELVIAFVAVFAVACSDRSHDEEIDRSDSTIIEGPWLDEYRAQIEADKACKARFLSEFDSCNLRYGDDIRVTRTPKFADCLSESENELTRCCANGSADCVGVAKERKAEDGCRIEHERANEACRTSKTHQECWSEADAKRKSCCTGLPLTCNQ